MEKKSLVSKKTAPSSKSNPSRVDLTKPAAVRLLACSSGRHMSKVTIEM